MTAAAETPGDGTLSVKNSFCNLLKLCQSRMWPGLKPERMDVEIFCEIHDKSAETLIEFVLKLF